MTKRKNIDEKIEKIANHFKVSPLIIARKALDQGYINQEKYNKLAKLTKEKISANLSRRKSGGGDATKNALS